MYVEGNVRPQTKKPPPVDGAVNDHHLMSVSNAANDVAAGRLIAGQLLIYDLDETPPPASPGTTQEDGPVPDDGECGLNRRGLALATALSGGVAAGLLVVTLVLAVRLRQIGGGGGVVGGKGGTKNYYFLNIEVSKFKILETYAIIRLDLSLGLGF